MIEKATHILTTEHRPPEYIRPLVLPNGKEAAGVWSLLPPHARALMAGILDQPSRRKSWRAATLALQEMHREAKDTLWKVPSRSAISGMIGRNFGGDEKSFIKHLREGLDTSLINLGNARADAFLTVYKPNGSATAAQIAARKITIRLAQAAGGSLKKLPGLLGNTSKHDALQSAPLESSDHLRTLIHNHMRNFVQSIKPDGYERYHDTYMFEMLSLDFSVSLLGVPSAMLRVTRTNYDTERHEKLLAQLLKEELQKPESSLRALLRSVNEFRIREGKRPILQVRVEWKPNENGSEVLDTIPI